MSDMFKPTEESRAILRALHSRLNDAADKEFFDSWEAEIADPDAPRMAGSIVANAYMHFAARYAVFGAHCAGREPSLQTWLALAEDHFRDAVKDVATAFVQTAVEPDQEQVSRQEQR